MNQNPEKPTRSISTHALTWSATTMWEDLGEDAVNFNSRTHVECDMLNYQAEIANYDFNSRTHVECDILLHFIFRNEQNFNSRTHVECDLCQWDTNQSARISTHALTWSATSSRSRQYVSAVFQLTHSRGVRRLYLDRISYPDNFNSRTHVECDGRCC